MTYGRLLPIEMRLLKQLEEKNTRLKMPMAELSSGKDTQERNPHAAIGK